MIHCAWGAILRQSDSTPLHKTVPPNPIRLEENTINPWVLDQRHPNKRHLYQLQGKTNKQTQANKER